MPPEITYLVANYNNGCFIKDCLESLHAQTSPAWHCLIGDDGSTDDSVALMQPWLNAQIELVVNERNLGKSLTLARLIERSPTDIVGILDPDDALYPEATALVLQAYQQHDQVGGKGREGGHGDQAVQIAHLQHIAQGGRQHRRKQRGGQLAIAAGFQAQRGR